MSYKTNVLSIHISTREKYFFQVGKSMYSHKIGLLPNVFQEMFLMTNQVHSYNTRDSNTFYLFPARKNIRRYIYIYIQLTE